MPNRNTKYKPTTEPVAGTQHEGKSKQSRDLTAAQYTAALKRHGFKPVGFMGYYDVGDGLSVSVLNAGLKATRRTKLAYLINARDAAIAKAEGHHV